MSPEFLLLDYLIADRFLAQDYLISDRYLAPDYLISDRFLAPSGGLTETDQGHNMVTQDRYHNIHIFINAPALEQAHDVP